MGLTLATPIANARTILNDIEEEYRYSDPDLLDYANGAIRVLAEAKPEWLLAVVTHTCVAGARQSLNADESHRFVSVVGLTQADRSALDAFSPAWRTAVPAGSAAQWMPVPGSPLDFEVYPPAELDQELSIEHIKAPGPFAATDDTGLPATLSDAFAEYICGMAEMRDDEHVNSGRVDALHARFLARLGIKTKASA